MVPKYPILIGAAMVWTLRWTCITLQTCENTDSQDYLERTWSSRSGLQYDKGISQRFPRAVDAARDHTVRLAAPGLLILITHLFHLTVHSQLCWNNWVYIGYETLAPSHRSTWWKGDQISKKSDVSSWVIVTPQGMSTTIGRTWE